MESAQAASPLNDEILTQFLEMTEDRVDPDVAVSLLEAVGWDVQAAMEQLFGTASPSRSGTAAPVLRIPEDVMPDEQLLSMAGGGEVVPGFQLQEGATLTDGLLSGLNDQEGADAELAAAIEASYRAQTNVGREESEEEMMMRALQMSQANEENRQRQLLREQQEAELAESVLMDQHREQEEQRQRAQEEERRQLAEQARIEAERGAEAAARELEAKRARLPAEPGAGEAGRMQLMLRLPNGQRLQRAFRSSEAVGLLYDYVDVQCQELAGQRYRLVSTRPWKAYEDRQQTIEASGIQNQFALMVEICSGL